MGGPDEVLKFINRFKGCEDVFLNGCCYWFAWILLARFPGRIMYLPVLSHFVIEISERLYDITGDVTERYRAEAVVPWDRMDAYDSSVKDRVVRDIIL